MSLLSKLTEEQYLNIERAAEFRSEFLDSEMFAMSGDSLNHESRYIRMGFASSSTHRPTATSNALDCKPAKAEAGRW